MTFFKILQNSQETTCAVLSFLAKLQALSLEVIEKFQKKSTENTCARVSFLIKNKVTGFCLQLYSEKDSDTNVFL